MSFIVVAPKNTAVPPLVCVLCKREIVVDQSDFPNDYFIAYGDKRGVGKGSFHRKCFYGEDIGGGDASNK